MRPLALVLGLAACRQTLRPDIPADKSAVPAWEELLGRIVDGNGYVDYDLLESERSALDGYVAWLASAEAWPGKVTRDWHAQYLNAYNAFVLYQVLERDRPESVLDIRGVTMIPGFRFFHFTQFSLGGERLTLSEIENERIRWKEMDYRDHAALSCASKSCPPLRDELYRSGDLARQLDDQWRRWMNDEERGVRIEADHAVFNPIVDWYERDFDFFTGGVDPCTLAASVINNAKRRNALYDLAAEGCPREYFDYDWSLNDAKTVTATSPRR